MKLPAPVLSPVDAVTWRLTEDYAVSVAGWRYTIAAGFLTDGASIPRAFWRVVGHPLFGDSLPAAILHDCLYRSEYWQREYSDALFRKLLIRNGVPRWRAWLMYRAVRAFGGFQWPHAEASRQTARGFLAVRLDPATAGDETI
jgi:hypothetical protein